MVATLAATLLGYIWQDGAGAALFAIAGLWFHLGPGRAWGLTPLQLAFLMIVACVCPSILWIAGYAWPGMAEAAWQFAQPLLERALAPTGADEAAYDTLARKGLIHHFPAVRLGIASAWFLALPAGALIVLCWRGKVVERRWSRDGSYYDPMTLLFASAPLIALLSALLLGGFGFGSERRNLALGGGVLYQPIFFGLWLISIGGLRTWANWWFADDAPGKRPPPP